MSNQPQPRPWFRLATLARASQPQTPAPASTPQPSQPQTPATRPQAQPAPMPRPALMRPPTFRPSTQPSAPQETAPRAPAPTPSAPVPPQSVTSAARPASAPAARPASAPATPSPPPTTTTSAPRAPAPAPRAPAPAPPAAVAAQPPAPAPAIRSPPTPSPASPVSQKSPPTSSMPSPPQSPALPSPAKPKVQTTPPPPSPAISRSVPASPPKPTSPSSPPKVTSPSVKQMTPPTMPTFSPPKPPARDMVAPSVPTSYPPKTSNGSPVTARAPIPAASPREAKPLPETPPQSPKTKPSLAPPSPFSLPPSQMKSEGERGAKFPSEAEKKTVHVQQTAGKPKQQLESHRSAGGGSQKAQAGMYVKPKDRDSYKKFSDSEDSGVRFITITGENTGAVMELGYSPSGRGVSLGSPHKLKSGGDQLSEGNLSGNEDRSKLQAGDHNATAKPPVPMHAYMNSNVQGINSSIVFNSTCSHHDPGVHLSVTRKPLNNGHGHGLQLKDHSSGKNNFQKERGQWFSE